MLKKIYRTIFAFTCVFAISGCYETEFPVLHSGETVENIIGSYAGKFLGWDNIEMFKIMDASMGKHSKNYMLKLNGESYPLKIAKLHDEDYLVQTLNGDTKDKRTYVIFIIRLTDKGFAIVAPATYENEKIDLLKSQHNIEIARPDFEHMMPIVKGGTTDLIEYMKNHYKVETKVIAVFSKS